jgi:hypothetical protein
MSMTTSVSAAVLALLLVTAGTSVPASASAMHGDVLQMVSPRDGDPEPGIEDVAPNVWQVDPGDGQITLGWSAAVTGLVMAEEYVIEMKDGDGSWERYDVVDGASLSSTVTGLLNGQQYGFRVRGDAQGQEGAWSVERFATPRTTPDAPRITSAQPLGNSWSLAWTVDADGGSPITGYVIQLSPDDGATWVDASRPSSTTATVDVERGGRYLVRIAAENAAGLGPWSATAADILKTPPSSPSLRPVTSATWASKSMWWSGDGVIRLQWTAPEFDGGSPLTGYSVQASADSGTIWTDLEQKQRELDGYVEMESSGGYTLGAEYQFRVAARNAEGSGPWSEISTYNLQIDPSSPVLTGHAQNGSVALSWSLLSDGGSPLTDYTLKYFSGTIEDYDHYDPDSYTELTLPASEDPRRPEPCGNGFILRISSPDRRPLDAVHRRDLGTAKTAHLTEGKARADIGLPR